MVKNSGKLVDFSKITNFEQASKEFAEGNASLEQLLLTCFKKRIATRACCAGHDKMNGPLIIFEDEEENREYMLSILSALRDKGFSISYSFKKPELKASWSFKDVNANFENTDTSDAWEALENLKSINAKTSILYALVGERKRFLLQPFPKKQIRIANMKEKR